MSSRESQSQIMCHLFTNWSNDLWWVLYSLPSRSIAYIYTTTNWIVQLSKYEVAVSTEAVTDHPSICLLFHILSLLSRFLLQWVYVNQPETLTGAISLEWHWRFGSVRVTAGETWAALPLIPRLLPVVLPRLGGVMGGRGRRRGCDRCSKNRERGREGGKKTEQ